MISAFPHFKQISAEDREEVRRFIDGHKPYSDFDFTNLFIWDQDSKRGIAHLNGNLVMRSSDYLNADPVLSFIGTNALEDTTEELLSYAEANDMPAVLRYIPEEIAHKLHKDTRFAIQHDYGNYDYIFSTLELSSLEGSEFKKRRKAVNRFKRTYPNTMFSVHSLSKQDHTDQLLALFERWTQQKGQDIGYDVSLEKNALVRILEHGERPDILVSLLHIDDVLIGFGIDELLPNHYAISHFVKADFAYPGSYDSLNTFTAGHLLQKGIRFWNWEQDLDIEGLRMLKRSYRPVNYLRKYKVSRR